MLHRPDYSAASRHARLFELIRQRNMADAARLRSLAAKPQDGNDHQLFLQRAERSFVTEPAAQAVL